MFNLLSFIKNQYFWFIILLAFGLWVRLYKIDAPIADWHSWRQADTAAVTRNFINKGFTPLSPKGDDMSTVSEVGIANLNRFRFVEFPIYNIAVYPFYLILGLNEMYHRLVSVLFSLGSIVFLYLL
ncbi:MAG: PMT family glycosyltransferase, 4-amino-4-deoxy-L-arabinose transferase, partial [Microgenomates group bacterium Gr01-1014_93]